MQTKKNCVICGVPGRLPSDPESNKPRLDVMHLTGNESHGETANLAYGCRSCNAKLAAAFKSIGAGRPTKQYNPSQTFNDEDEANAYARELKDDGHKGVSVERKAHTDGGDVYLVKWRSLRPAKWNPSKSTIPTFAQYAWAVTQGNREHWVRGVGKVAGGKDEWGAIIHATPKHKRIEYAKRIAQKAVHTKRAAADERWNPETRRNSIIWEDDGDTPLIRQAEAARSVEELARLHKYAIGRRDGAALLAAVETRAAALGIRHAELTAAHPRQWNPSTQPGQKMAQWTSDEFTNIVGTARDGASTVARHTMEQIRKEQKRGAGWIVEIVDSARRHVAYVLVRSTARGKSSVEELAAYFYGASTGDFSRHDAMLKRNPVHLQGMGSYESMALDQVQPGMKIMYNYGLTATVVSVEPKGKSISLVTRDDKSGNVYTRLKRATTQVVAFWPRETKGNPEDSAAALYESFHGKPADEELLIEEEVHVHENLSVLGRAVECWIDTPSGLRACVEFDQDVNAEPIMLCSAENGKQLYFEGGDQKIDLKSLQMDGEEWVKDRMVLGQFSAPEPRGAKRRKHNLTYNTRKDFDQFETIDYQHDLGEESGVRPYLEYDPRNQHLYITGGQYFINQPLLETSPGIEN